MKRVLVYGFRPFHQLPSNPSEEVIQRLQAEPWATLRPEFTVLDVTPEAVDRVFDGVQRRQSEYLAVLGLGVRSGSTALRIERFAHNLFIPRELSTGVETGPARPIVPNSPAAYQTVLDLEILVEALSKEGIPAFTSNDPDDFICNYAYYKSLAALSYGSRNYSAPALFVHLPITHTMAARLNPKMPSMALETLLAGVRAILSHIGSLFPAAQ